MNLTNNCTHPQHNNYPIQGFCLNLQCKVTSQCCSLCPQDNHNTHKNDCKNSVEIKKMMLNYYNMLCDWKKRLGNSQQLEEKEKNYIEKQTEIVIELHEKMKVKSLQTLNSEIQRIKFWNSHYSIGSKMDNNNLQGIVQKLKGFQESMKNFDNEYHQYEEHKEQEKLQQKPQSPIIDDNDKQLAEQEMLQGQKLHKQELYTNAIKCFDQAIHFNSKLAEAHMCKGDSLHEIKQNEEAIACFDQAMKFFEEENQTHLKLTALWKKGNSLQELKNYDEAIYCYDQVLQEEPDFYLANVDKGVLLQSLKKHDEAIVCFDLAIETHPSCVDAITKKGISLNSKKLFQEAIACFDQAIQIDPNFIESFLEKSTSLKQQNNYGDSIDCIEKALKIDRENKRALKRKSILLQKQAQQNEQPNQEGLYAEF